MEERKRRRLISERAGRGGGEIACSVRGKCRTPYASRLTAGARAAVLPLVRRQRENAAARRRRDEAVGCLADIAATFFRTQCLCECADFAGQKAGQPNRASAGKPATTRPSDAVRKAGTTPRAVVGLCVRPRLRVTQHSTYSKSNLRNPTRVEPVRNPALGQRRARELLQRRRRDD